jgi:hypothetical protein
MIKDTELILKTARRCLELDLNPLPCNQHKAPQGLKQDDDSYEWKMFQRRQITIEEFQACINGNTHGLGIVCGKVCGMLEVIDIDHKYDITGNLVNGYFKLINDNDPELFNSLFIVRTPTYGYHLYYRCEVIEGNQKLAKRYTTEDERKQNGREKVKVLIETRGEGGYIVCPPTPGYEPWQKNDIPTITAEQRKFLLDAARSFNEVHEEVKKAPREQTGMVSPWEVSPWDDFDERGDIDALLIKNDWKEDHKTADRIYYTRPGKDRGTSADYHKERRLFKCWSTSQGDFEEQKAYSHTAVYAKLECHGDFAKASEQLERQGYGKRKPIETRQEPAKVRDQPEQQAGATPLDLEKLFRSKILDQSKEYPVPVPVISLQHNETLYPLLTLKSFSLWQGKQKSKKTVTLALMIAAYLRETISRKQIDFIGEGGGTVLWIDCEQGESYAARTMKLILKLAGVDRSDRLIYCDFRDSAPSERMLLIQTGIKCTHGAQLVIIDGVVDLMNDFMEAAEGHGVITQLLALCSIYNIHIAGVLHQNKADKNARAHVGSIGSQKCELEVSTEVDADDKARSIVSCVNARGVPFESFAIRWDKGALPCIETDFQAGTSKTDVKSVKEYERQKDVLKAVFKPFAALTHTEAQKQIMSITKKGESTATRLIKNMKGWGWIDQGEDKLYRLIV